MIKKTKRQSKYFAPQNKEGEAHVCDHPGCNKRGEYRAPKNSYLKEYYWFCLEHVQEYNSKWNYYGNEYDVEPEQDSFCHFNFSSHIKYNFGFDFEKGYNFFDTSAVNAPEIRFSLEEKRALKIMELEYSELTVDSLKKAYKKAVKKYHPDLNSANRELEEIFKVLSTSYKSLLKKLSQNH